MVVISDCLMGFLLPSKRGRIAESGGIDVIARASMVVVVGGRQGKYAKLYLRLHAYSFPCISKPLRKAWMTMSMFKGRALWPMTPIRHTFPTVGPSPPAISSE